MALTAQNYQFILGARIKNENHSLQKEITTVQWKNGQTQTYPKTDNTKLIVNYSNTRAAKDKHNREKGLRRLEKLIRTGKLTKQQINNRGYNKYLKLEGAVQVKIDYEKFNIDNKWDGLKGIVYDNNLCPEVVLYACC